MTTSKLFRSPVAHRSGAILAAAFLLLAGVREAGAAPSASGSSGSSASSAAKATASRSASAMASTSASNDKATTAATSSPAAADCPAQVRITLGRMTVSDGMVTIAFTHNAHNCQSARPALLHLHQNLLRTPRAGSDPVHQWNADLQIGPNHPDGVTVPLLESADGKCFVQVDAHASGQTRGQFFPTTTCSSASPSTPSTPASSSSAPSTPGSSSSAPSTPASSSTTATSTASTSTAPSTTSQSFLPETTSRTTATRSLLPVGQVEQPPTGSLPNTGSSVAAPMGLAAGLLLTGALLVALSRRPRRH